MLDNEANQAIVTFGKDHHMLMTVDAATHMLAAYLSGSPCNATGVPMDKQDVVPTLIVQPLIKAKGAVFNHRP